MQIHPLNIPVFFSNVRLALHGNKPIFTGKLMFIQSTRYFIALSFEMEVDLLYHLKFESASQAPASICLLSKCTGGTVTLGFRIMYKNGSTYIVAYTSALCMCMREMHVPCVESMKE